MSIVVVSGGSSGIGKACVAKFLSAGNRVYNMDIVECKELTHTANYKYIYTDIKNHENIKHSVAQILSDAHVIEVLVISAGKHLSATIEDTNDEQLMDILQLNLLGAYWLIQESIPVMKANNKGRIIAVGSDQCSIAKRNSTVYGMTKAGLLGLTKSIALDYAKYNIRANCIGAGTIDTPLYTDAINNYAQKSGIALATIKQEEANQQPVGRIGKAEEIAELAFFLASDASDFITGALLPIDGGYIAQ